MSRLSESQLVALLGETGWLLYLRDRAMRDYHFMKIDQKKLAEADLGEPPDPVAEEARRRFLNTYGLPELQRKRPTKRAVRDLLRALPKGWVPGWVLAVAPPLSELEELAK